LSFFDAYCLSSWSKCQPFARIHARRRPCHSLIAVSQKNAPTLGRCSFDKHGLIFTFFGKQHQHTFKNNVHVQLSLSLHVYLGLLYFPLNSCDGNDAFWPSLVKQSSSFSSKHRTLSLHICVRQTVWLTTEFVDWCRNVCILYNYLSTTPAAVTSYLKQDVHWHMGKHITYVIDKAVGQWRKQLRASTKAK